MEAGNNNSGKEVLVIFQLYSSFYSIGSINEEVSDRWNARVARADD